MTVFSGPRLQGAIFDVDGTLLDSMCIWQSVGPDYLRSLGIVPEPDLADRFRAFSLRDAAAYLQSRYGVARTVPEIMDDINGMVEQFYRQQALPKPGIPALLELLQAHRIPMCIATATDRYLVEAALERAGLLGYFREIFSCTDVGGSKREPRIFRLALQCLGTEKAGTYVFEDSLHAAVTAARDGFPVAAVYDPAEPDPEALARTARLRLPDFRDLTAVRRLLPDTVP